MGLVGGRCLNPRGATDPAVEAPNQRFIVPDRLPESMPVSRSFLPLTGSENAC